MTSHNCSIIVQIIVFFVNTLLTKCYELPQEAISKSIVSFWTRRPARLRQRERRTLRACTVKRSIELTDFDTSVLAITLKIVFFCAFQTCYMLHMRVKVGCIVIYFSAKLKNGLLYSKLCNLWRTKDKTIKFATVMGLMASCRA